MMHAAGIAISALKLPFSIFAPTSAAARELARLGWFVTLTFCGVAIVTTVLIVLAALRPAGTLDEHAPVDLDTGKRWIVIGGVILPFLILGIVFVVGLSVLGAFPLHREAVDLRLTVEARQWWWDVSYDRDGATRTANEIHLPAGRTVEIALVSSDVIHSFWVPRLHGKLDVIPGITNRLRIKPDSVGVFQGECAEFCGAQHAHMRFLVIVEPPERFARWLSAQRARAATPANAQARLGHDLFMSRACATCHAIRGTAAQATLGPDLTHLASRQMIAAGTLPNNRANLQAWVTSAQTLKPRALMPNVPLFNGEELNALVTYLETLR